jgi:hypothetical protein
VNPPPENEPEVEVPPVKDVPPVKLVPPPNEVPPPNVVGVEGATVWASAADVQASTAMPTRMNKPLR